MSEKPASFENIRIGCTELFDGVRTYARVILGMTAVVGIASLHVRDGWREARDEELALTAKYDELCEQRETRDSDVIKADKAAQEASAKRLDLEGDEPN
jgi:hypothetical protein